MQGKWSIILSTLLLLSLLVACSTGASTESTTGTAAAIQPTAAADAVADTATGDAEEEEVARPAGWSKETHSNDVDPNYAIVFPQDKVNQITIAIAPDDWEAMQADLTDILGEPGTGQGMGPVGGKWAAVAAWAGARSLWIAPT